MRGRGRPSAKHTISFTARPSARHREEDNPRGARLIYLDVPGSRHLAVWRCTFIGRYLLGELRRCTVTCCKNRAMARFDNGPRPFALAEDHIADFQMTNASGEGELLSVRSYTQFSIRWANWQESSTSPSQQSAVKRTLSGSCANKSMSKAIQEQSPDRLHSRLSAFARNNRKLT
jgi:hypothetical protein